MKPMKERIVTVRALRRALNAKHYTGDEPVVLSCGAEGNGFSVLQNIERTPLAITDKRDAADVDPSEIVQCVLLWPEHGRSPE